MRHRAVVLTAVARAAVAHVSSSWRDTLVRSARDARDRCVLGLWPLLQQTAAATLAWVVAVHVVEHHQPFFAPIAAVVGLNAAMGERGTNAVRLLLGAVVGILGGELTLVTIG